MAAAVYGSALLWIALLLFSPDGMIMATQKSVLSLNPPWYRVFERDNVTLTCNKNNLTEDSPTMWTHNGIRFSTNTANYNIVNASSQDSGEYRCCSQNLYWSNRVHLEVLKDWLLLQTSPNVVLEGEPLYLRCHGWRNWIVYKTLYYKDGKVFKYNYENNNAIIIKNMTANDSGTYCCSGYLNSKHWEESDKCSSQPLKITVLKAYQSKNIWLELVIPLLVVTLFVGDTWLFFSTDKQFKSLLKMKTTGQNPHPVASPQRKDVVA
ncbi:high affinity immunoglobulin epsilon receptor subunit alpha [Cavia porcellus]|uniref:high affinity immunoglobulin epsilon receptor subunit alpha n=1 Tax=Cavia porcellus TaxID=10141 RepID=UPI0003512C85|nr:high affinity immunoglobulin epsilon receptor subunit alpha [Cavia porcellus]